MCQVIGFWWGFFCLFFILFYFFEKMHLIKEGKGLQCKNIVVFLQFSPQRMLKDCNVIKKSDFRFKKRILKFTKEKLLLQQV